MTRIGPWEGGTRARNLAGAVGAAGLALTLLGGILGDPRRALFGYLVAFVYWLGIALGLLILLAAFHAASAKWPVVLRRFLESASASIPIFVVLFLPILLGRAHLFPWVNFDALGGELRHLVEHKRPYLNVPGFAIRAVIYFVCWIGVAHLLRAWSLRQDQEGGIDLTRSQRRLGAASLPFLALTMTFAAFDWMMSLDPRFYSTIFGVYWWAGSFMGAFAVTLIAAAATRDDPSQFGAHMSAEHFHSLGNFLLSFVAFWGYVAFSQFMLIWIANVPEEVPWYVVRINGGWLRVGSFLAIFKFLVPFFLLFSRARKRDPRRVARVAAWLLLTQWVDLYWVIMPSLHPDGPRPSLWDLTAFVGVGGIAVAFTLARARGVVPVPVRDPYLDDSLRYMPP
jgi:hypothetical protein